ncbi:regulator of amino acid metabolism, contains ACT domain protein [Methanoplanus sp. FWC-SCC4]|uniref:Regulator of amino acid metabolism, contains ACT domain protein n=1 Tax=Methanochimaera problematica TaxID=2609417 RepID=A0AA97FEB1_9EURY|nr:regulator of amino acid metabolism, contains ACT domain protein [Methanoplanus sp. FWC-SCC4]WOF15876.1 regulator of amino acid metabolism, contains ACT domain protein [Methanoplanus sp. FWC-SCC4]
MWSDILKEFSDSPSQTIVVKYLLENGFGVNEKGRVICNDIEIPATHIGRETNTDRRVVDVTAKRILSLPKIRDIFLRLKVTPDLTEVSETLGLSVIAIYPKDAKQKGIVNAALEVLTRHDLSIRQIFVTDSELSQDPRLVIIVEENPPAVVYNELRKLPQVKRIVI